MVIDGPVSGLIYSPQIFTAVVSPTLYTYPLTFTWQATGLSPITHISGSTDTLSFTWGITGTQTITVTAENPLGLVIDCYNVLVNDVADVLYFPAMTSNVTVPER